ncbi:MAG TPA: PQQ-binding-like beta-propeller repeat protein [Myxococcota bacterium]|nr:PQQ-binding-like beta-propeller repeat protein [Myxococcota bacterium]
MIVWAWLAAWAGEIHGWRNDGTNVFPQAAITSLGAEGATVWSAPLGTWGNASPVLVGGRVCTTWEPTRIGCFDAATGRAVWKGDNDVLDALPADLAAIIRPQVEAAAQAETKLAELKRTYSGLQRDARRAPDDAALQARLVETAAEMDRLKTTVDSVVDYRTPADKEIIGYASATPVSDGAALYAVFGTGVVAAWSVDGRRLWSRWLGPHKLQMRGYHLGTAASPLLVDGVLVVPWDHLVGLDPATGATRWDAGEYRDYGTPAVAHVGGVGVLATPDGRLVRASDGKVQQTGLGNIWYVGPVADGVDVYYVGSTSDGHTTKHSERTVAAALRLEASGGAVRATPRWTVDLPTTQTFYAQPVLADGVLYAVTHRGEARGLSTADGAILYTQDLQARLYAEVFASPTVAGGSLVVLGATGIVIVGKTGGAWQDVWEGRIGTMRGTPVYQGDRAWLHTYDGLLCVRTR